MFYFLKEKRGITLIEMLVVITLLSIVAVTVIPRTTSFFTNRRENFTLLTGIIARTYDDSYLNDRINYLTFHLYETSLESEEKADKIFSRHNGVSVLNLENNKFVDNPKKILKHRSFPDSFKLEKVVFSNGRKMSEGNVLIPFYPGGYSDNIILHVLVNDEERMSVRIFKHMKEPEILRDFKNFEE